MLVVPIASAIVAAPGDLTEDFLEAQRGAALLFAFACAEGADAADHALLGGALARLAHASLDGVPANKVLAWCPGAQELARLAVDCYGLARGGR